MFYKGPKDNREFHWTEHIKRKMRQYGISESRIRQILRKPQRREMGVAPKTIGVMQLAGSKKKPHEIWVMYMEIGKKPISSYQLSASSRQLEAVSRESRKRKVMISAWRYPSISPKGQPIPIPEDILEELSVSDLRGRKIFPTSQVGIRRN